MFFLLLLCCLLCMGGMQSVAENPMVVIIPSYHNAFQHRHPGYAQKPFYEANLDSVFAQRYPNVRVIYIADADYLPDSDGTGALVEQYIKDRGYENRITLIRNKDRSLALKNWYKAILSCADNEIVVALDGDDILAHPEVLAHVNELYADSKKDIWFTYGNYQFLSNGQVWWMTQEVPSDVVANNTIRSWGNGPTHLKTFKAWLFKQIRLIDLFYQNDFYTMAPDIAMYTPMLEMAINHIKTTQESLYIYNDMNPLNEHRVDRSMQHFMDQHVRHKSAYAPLKESKEGWVDEMKKRGLLTTDVVVFAHGDSAHLHQYLSDLESKLDHVARIFVLYQPDQHSYQPESDLFVQTDKIRFINLEQGDIASFLKTVRLSSEVPYIAFIDDSMPVSCELDLEKALYWLETTHAFGFQLLLKRSFFDAFQKDHGVALPLVQVTLKADEPSTIFGWRFNPQAAELNKLVNFTLYRKNDIQRILADSSVWSKTNLEAMWKNCLSSEQVYLFYRGS